jgi:hypothetical protein
MKYSFDNILFSNGTSESRWPGPPHYRGFTITLGHTTVGRTPLDEGPARRRDLYLARHNNHNRQTNISPPEFETTIPASERPQNHALDRVATGHSTILVYDLLTASLNKSEVEMRLTLTIFVNSNLNRPLWLPTTHFQIHNHLHV